MLARFVLIVALALAAPVMAQQRPDASADVSVASPAWPSRQGPVVAIDGGHNNFHTASGGYGPFARLLANDGFQVVSADGAFTAQSLGGVKILVISNPLAGSNVGNWRLPTPSAFTPDEIAVVEAWVEQGGSLFLIADHMPFAGAAGDLAAAFGFEFDNGFAREGQGPETFSRRNGRMLESPITKGVTSVESFTGSSFTAPQAQAVLALDERFQIVKPQIAWRFEGAPARKASSADLRLATREIGSGRVVVAGEAAMFTAQVAGPEGRQHVGFGARGAEQNKALTLNVAHWLARR